VLVTRPGQVYDVDPTRSDRLWMVESEVSGAGPRPFEADQRMQRTLYQLDVARPFERWTVLARTTGAPTRIAAEDLGLDPAREYVAFDFWEGVAAGVFKDTLTAAPVAEHEVQVLCLRERVDHPQLLATDRHVSSGGVELQDMRWSGDALSGRLSRWDRGRGMLYVTQPAGWELESVEVSDGRAGLGELVTPSEANGLRWRRVSITSAAPFIDWTIRYRRAP